MEDHDVTVRSLSLYANGESKLEAAKHCTEKPEMYRDCAGLSYGAILYGMKAALAVDDALPEEDSGVFELFQEFHVGSEAFPEECWIRMRAVKALYEICETDADYRPVEEEITESVESAEYMLLLVNMFLIGRGVSA